MALSEQELMQVLEMFQKSGWQTMHLQSGSRRLSISKTGALSTSHLPRAGERNSAAPASPSPGPSDHPLPQAGEGKRIDAHWVALRAPMLGTFYAAPKPGAAAFVRLGQEVSAEDTVGILEVMKLMNYIKAGVAGRIARIEVADGELAEFDQVLFYIEPTRGDAAGRETAA